MQVDAFVFEWSPEPLDLHIVHPVATPVHADADLGVPQDGGERDAGKLAALIGVEDFRSPMAPQRLFQRQHIEAGIHRVR